MNLPTVGHSFTSFDTINSTNIHAMECIREGLAVHGQVFFAREQTEGRGQRGKKWWSPPGENIQMTLVLQPLKLAPSQHFRLSAAIATGVHDLLQNEYPTGWQIKWPNDLYWNDRKAGGILIENVIQSGKWMWAVVGIGLNVNSKQFDPALPNPTSLSLATGKEFEVEELAKRLCLFVDHRFRQLMAGDWLQILGDYNRELYKAGEYQKLKQASAVASFLINRVDEQGMLIAGENAEYRFAHGEVEWIV